MISGRKNQKAILPFLFSFLLLAAVIFWLINGINSASEAQETERLASVKDLVIKSAVVCYSIEGSYPADTGYLSEHYGLSYDTDRYIVHYEYSGANMMPRVSVIAK